MKHTLIITLVLLAVSCKENKKPVDNKTNQVVYPTVNFSSGEHYPQILQNDCGKYAVRWYDVVINNDTSYYYIGLDSKQVKAQYWVAGGSYQQETPLETYKNARHDKIWGGDTIYNAKQELLFSTLDQAEAAIAGGHHREDLERDFLDSINKCHTWHKIPNQ